MMQGSCNNEELQKLIARKRELLSFETEEKMTWCGGCGNYAIQNALKRALAMEGLGVRDFTLFFDIGCSGNGSDKFEAYTFHGLHGRVLPLASGACLANTSMKVIASAGDGAMMSEGINHLVHSVRSNYPMVFILHNNQNYALTTGQGSATTRKGCAMNGSPDGVPLSPMNPSEFVLNLDPTFVARTFSGDVKLTTEVLQLALRHKGFAFVEIMQSCPTYSKSTPNEWFWSRVKNVSQIEGYDVGNLAMAKVTAHDMEDQIGVGVLYQSEVLPQFMELLPQRKGVDTLLTQEVKAYDITKFLKRYS